MDPAMSMLKFFENEHLPSHLKAASSPFKEIAQKIVDTIPPGPERTAGMRKLLEAKDCVVRACL